MLSIVLAQIYKRTKATTEPLICFVSCLLAHPHLKSRASIMPCLSVEGERQVKHVSVLILWTVFSQDVSM